MKKLLALAMGIALFSNLYGFTIGAGIAGYDVARAGRSFSLLADAALPIIPILHCAPASSTSIFTLNRR